MNSRFDFLAGGGAMGAIMRRTDWSATSMGDPETWASTLKSALRILLTSNHPMFICWGPTRMRFCNDALCQLLSHRQRSAAPGQCAPDCCTEAWDIFAADIDEVMAGKGPVWREDQPVPVTRAGQREQLWLTYSQSPVEDASGIGGVLVICTNVTEQHRQREKIERSYESVVGGMDEAFCLVELLRDADGNARDYRFLEVNRAFGEQTGLRDVVGKTVKEVVPGIDPQWIHSFDEVARSGKPGRFVDVVPQLGRWFNVYASPHWGRGHECCVAVLFSDITSAREHAEALRKSEANAKAAAALAETERRRMDALVDTVPVGIVYTDERGLLIRANAMNRQLWGAHPMSGSVSDYAAWKGWWADGSARQGQPVRADEWPLARVLAGDGLTAGTFEIEPFGMPGVRRTMFAQATAVRDEAGAVTGAVAASMDITEQVAVARALQESESQFRTIAEAMPQMVWASTPDGRNEYTNSRWREFTGLPAAAFLDDGWTQLIHPDDLPSVLQAWNESLRTGAVYEQSHRLKHRSGTYRWVLNRALPVRAHDGHIVRWIGTMTDVHEQKLTAQALADASQKKDEFLAVLAHELRNPLAPISAAAQMLKLMQGDADKVGQASDVIGRQVRHMTELVDDLLDVSRVTRGLVDIERQPVDIKAVVGSAVEQARPMVEARRHTLVTRLGSDPSFVLGDQKRLVQIVANLLVNAAKYTPPGGEILLGLAVMGDEVICSVADNGIGIDQDFLPNIFELFAQAKRTSDRSQGGLGLGLALVKNLVKLHGGRIEAQSAGLGHGSTFIVALPLIAVDAGGG